eukprot:snap_masked-scaffold_8-processed-gene-6.40-mRNA-1 protein AED:1.00 eAED:1.00 QI:0/-1/0/0/-1/1/1/0/205
MIKGTGGAVNVFRNDERHKTKYIFPQFCKEQINHKKLIPFHSKIFKFVEEQVVKAMTYEDEIIVTVTEEFIKNESKKGELVEEELNSNDLHELVLPFMPKKSVNFVAQIWKFLLKLVRDRISQEHITEVKDEEVNGPLFKKKNFMEDTLQSLKERNEIEKIKPKRYRKKRYRSRSRSRSRGKRRYRERSESPIKYERRRGRREKR